MSNLVDALDEAKRVLARPNGWCQGAGARDERGRACGSTEACARSWSLYGVVYLVAHRHNADPRALLRLFDARAHHEGFPSIGVGQGAQEFNDFNGRKIADVLRLVDYASRMVPA